MTPEIKNHIEKLQSEIDSLLKKDREEIASKILPFIREHCKCYYGGSYTRAFIRATSEVKTAELIKLMENANSSGPGWYHFGCPVAPKVDARFDDGELTLHFDIASYPGREEFIECIKSIGIPIDFSGHISDINRRVDILHKELDEIKKMSSEVNNPAA